MRIYRSVYGFDVAILNGQSIVILLFWQLTEHQHQLKLSDYNFRNLITLELADEETLNYVD